MFYPFFASSADYHRLTQIFITSVIIITDYNQSSINNQQSIIRAKGSKSVLICANLWSIKPPQTSPVVGSLLYVRPPAAKKLHSNHQIISIYPSSNNNPYVSSFILQSSSNGQLEQLFHSEKMHNFDAVVAVTKGIRIQNGKKVVVK